MAPMAGASRKLWPPAAGVEGEEAVDEGAELWNIIRAAVQLLMAETRAVEESVNDCDTVVPGFN